MPLRTVRVEGWKAKLAIATLAVMGLVVGVGCGGAVFVGIGVKVLVDVAVMVGVGDGIRATNGK